MARSCRVGKAAIACAARGLARESSNARAAELRLAQLAQPRTYAHHRLVQQASATPGGSEGSSPRLRPEGVPVVGHISPRMRIEAAVINACTMSGPVQRQQHSAAAARRPITGNMSHYDAQRAACRSVLANRSPSLPSRKSSWAIRSFEEGIGELNYSWESGSRLDNTNCDRRGLLSRSREFPGRRPRAGCYRNTLNKPSLDEESPRGDTEVQRRARMVPHQRPRVESKSEGEGAKVRKALADPRCPPPAQGLKEMRRRRNLSHEAVQQQSFGRTASAGKSCRSIEKSSSRGRSGQVREIGVSARRIARICLAGQKAQDRM